VLCSRSAAGRNDPLAALPSDRSDEIEVGVIVEDDRTELLGGSGYQEVWDLAAPLADLIVGKGHRSAIGTLLERTSRYVLLLHLPEGGTAEAVNAAMAEAIGRLPAELARSVTWDQGTEMSKHADFTIATGIQVYFCDPHSPWQRPSNENTNGLLRQFFPKGADLSLYSREDILDAERKLNGRPRKSLDWRKPSEKIAALVALTG